MNVQLREWLNIQNISVEKPYNKMMTDELGISNMDVCNLLTIDKCLYAEPICSIKNNQCIRSERLHKLHQKHVIITSRPDKIHFMVIESRHMTDIHLLTTTIQIYYVVLRSFATGNIYVLFSSGMVLTRDILYDNPAITEQVLLLNARLKSYCIENKTQKIALCGHSMGASLSMYTGVLFQKHYRKEFENNCVIFGTGIAKCLEDANFTRLPNIRQFISGELRRTKSTKPRLIIDCMITKGDLLLYDPIEYIYMDVAEDDTVEYITTTRTADVVITIGNETQCKKLHKWSYYLKLLLQIYNEPVQSTTPPSIIRIRRSRTGKRRQ
jgi:hypothetical protein